MSELKISEVKPCPFCGGPARLHQWPVPKIGKEEWEAWSVECLSEPEVHCNSGRHYLSPNSETAMAAWNNRAGLKAELDRISGPLVEAITSALVNRPDWQISAEKILANYRKERGE